MDVARGFVARDSAQFLHQRDDRIADAARAIRDVVEPQVLDSSRAADRVGDRRRNQAKFGFGACERSLDIEHELQMSVIGKQRADFVGAVERAENLRVGRIECSYVEEHRLVLSLQHDIESQDTSRYCLDSRDQRRASLGRDSVQHCVGSVQRLVGKIDPGDQPLQQSARENRHVDVRRLKQIAGTGNRAGLDRVKAKASAFVGRGAAESVKFGIDGVFPASRPDGRSGRPRWPARVRSSRR